MRGLTSDCCADSHGETVSDANESVVLRLSTLFPAALMIAVLGAVLSVPVAVDAGNTYVVSGLREYVTDTTDFTVLVDGDIPVCEMSFAVQSRDSAPWDFTYSTMTDDEHALIHIRECDGTSRTIDPEAIVPFKLMNATIYGDADDGAVDTTVRVENNLNMPAVATLYTPHGTVVDSVTVPFRGSAQVKVPTFMDVTTQFPLIISSMDGEVSSTTHVTVARGWAAFDLVGGKPLYAPCSQLTWAYQSYGQPEGALTFKDDIQPALDRLAKHTGLTFVETRDFSNADLRFSWDATLETGIAAMGSTEGTVRMSTIGRWPRDVNAGMSTGGRGWLIIHEVMHTLGFTHVDDRDSIMYRSSSGQSSFTEGDLNGLHELYRSHCRSD